MQYSTFLIHIVPLLYPRIALLQIFINFLKFSQKLYGKTQKYFTLLLTYLKKDVIIILTKLYTFTVLLVFYCSKLNRVFMGDFCYG